MTNEFYTTKNLFQNAISFDRPLSYEEWLAVADDNKAAVLYLQFFNEINLAWYKAHSFIGSEEEGVETVLQYLCKNVPIIASDRKKFNPRYIYRVAYNCLYCICHDRQIDKDRFELEVSNICTDSDGTTELDLFDTVRSSETADIALDKEAFWKIVEDMGVETETLVDYILTHGTLPGNMGKEKRAIVEMLRVRLADFQDVTFA